MARQFVGGTAIFPLTYIEKYEGGKLHRSYSINKGSSGAGRNATWKYSVTGGGTTNNAAALFTEMDKISKAGPGGPKLTIIDITMSFPGNQVTFSHHLNNTATYSRRNNTSIVRVYVDWEAKKVKWSGWIMGNQPSHKDRKGPGYYYALDAIADIPASTGLVNINATIGTDRYSRPTASSALVGQIGLDLVNRKITALPVFPLSGSTDTFWGDWNVKFNYQIETDDYQTVTVAPEPEPEPDPVAPIDVSGTKISELTPAETPLKDTDLLILSQGGEDGKYDSSNNITYAKLKEEVGGGGGGSYVEGYATTIGGTLVENGALLTVTHNLGTADVIVQVYIADDANGTNNVMLNNQTDGGGGFLYDYQAQTAATNSIKVQLSASGWTKNDGSAIAQHINYTAKFIKVVVLSA